MRAITWDAYGVRTSNPTKEELENEIQRLQEIQRKQLRADSMNVHNSRCTDRQHKIRVIKDLLDKMEN